MNFIQTLYISSDKNPFQDTFGWISPEYHLMGWALSCLQLKQIYGKVDLYANDAAADLLIKDLQLPYDTVHTELNSRKLPHPQLWALPKLFTYSLQNKPFLHIDGDVFVFEKFDNSLLNSELIGQNIEVATDYYISTQNLLEENFTFFPDCVKRDFDSKIPINAVNAGILGGHNIDFFKEYTKLAFEYIDKNVHNFQNIPVERFNVFFEQHLFYALAQEKQVNINVLIKEIYEDNAYDLGNFREVPFECNYIHLLGDLKRDDYACRQMATKLRELYPEYYYRIIALFRKKNIPISPSAFFDTNFEKKHNIAIQTYQNDCCLCLSNNQIFDEKENTFLSLLKNISEESENEKAKQDFELFYNNLLDKINHNFSEIYLYGRDLEAVNWYRNLFENEENLVQKQIVRCAETAVIQSKYNWAELFNKYYKSGAIFYGTVLLEEKECFNLVVFEATKNRFSLYDIDNLDSLILGFGTNSITVADLLEQTKPFFEADVIENHYGAFFNYIISRIKFLVEIKALKPVD